MLAITMIGRAVGILFPATLAATMACAETKTIDHQTAAKSFARICLSNLPTLEGFASSAKSLGLNPISKAQWSSSDFTISAVRIPSGKNAVVSKIDLGSLGIDGWDSINFGVKSSNRNGACAILASTPPEGLFKAVAAVTAKYGTPKTRVRAGGNSATINTNINHTSVRIFVKPSRLQGHRDFSLILIETQ